MKIKINQLGEEVCEKNVKIKQLKMELDYQLVNRNQEPTNVNKISVECQTIKVSIIVTDRIFDRKINVHDFYMNCKFK